MAMKRCPICGEKYSDTYRDCPFCEEEDALLDGEEIRRSPRRGKRASRSRQFNIITPTLVVLILIMAALLIYLLFGDKWGEKKPEEEPNTPPVENIMPEDPVDPEPGTQEGGDGTMPEDGQTPEPSATDYDAAMAPPDGLSLSTTDFTLSKTAETHTISVSGGSGTYSWVSQDEGVASVDNSGKVTAISRGTVNVVVTDGARKGVCIVRVTASGGAATTTTPQPSTGGSLKAGAAKVINAGNGVRVRSGPSTNHEILATLPNGADLKIVKSAGGDWYEITFANVGGVTTTGYMKGEFLQNK